MSILLFCHTLHHDCRYSLHGQVLNHYRDRLKQRCFEEFHKFVKVRDFPTHSDPSHLYVPYFTSKCISSRSASFLLACCLLPACTLLVAWLYTVGCLLACSVACLYTVCWLLGCLLRARCCCVVFSAKKPIDMSEALCCSGGTTPSAPCSGGGGGSWQKSWAATASWPGTSSLMQPWSLYTPYTPYTPYQAHS